jgi:uncharacterized membrane protein
MERGIPHSDSEPNESSLARVEHLFLWFILYSFLGWVWETVYCFVTEGVLQDRGILNSPLCPIYGFGALIVLFLLGDVFNPVALFLSSGVLTCTLEYLTSYALEKLFHIRLWDYSNQPLNIDGRVSLLGFLAFGAAATFFAFVLQPAVERKTAEIPPKVVHIFAGIFFVLFVADVVVTLLGLLGVNPGLAHFDEAVGHQLQGNTATAVTD